MRVHIVLHVPIIIVHGGGVDTTIADYTGILGGIKRIDLQEEEQEKL